MRTSKARLWIAATALAFYVLFVLRTSFRVGGTRYFVLFEDAMISMRYAQHLADGHGLVWNVGEPPIEGFTNLLWVLWMALAHALGLSESKISVFVMMTGITILLALGLVTSKIARKVSDAPWIPVAVLAATLFDYPLVFWTLRGMEVGALTLAVYTLLWLAFENEEQFSLRRTTIMALVTAAALLIRSDAVVPVALISLYGFVFCANRWIFAAVIGVAASTVALGQTAFRQAYFNETLPNTYFLKLHHIPLLARVKRGAFVGLEVLALHLAVPLSAAVASLLATTSVARTRWREAFETPNARRVGLLGALFVAQIAYATYVGGDAWEWMLYANRYVCVGMPALIVLTTILVSRLVSASADARAVFARHLATGLVLAGSVLLLLNGYAHRFPEQGIAATIVFGKTPFAAGAVFVTVGITMRLLRDVKDGIGDALAAAERRLASRKTAVAAALVMTAVVWAPCHLLPVGRWLVQNAAQYQDEAHYTRLGILIAATTPPGLRIAVAAAGATPYFSRRPTEDLLGKNDRHVAKLPPRGVFSPGHDKWDYRYSLGARNTQLLVEPVDVTPEDETYLESLGFVKLENGMRIRRSAPVEPKRLVVLGREIPDGEALHAALRELAFPLGTAMRVVDFLMILVFGVVIAATVRRVVNDDESLTGLSSEPPPADPELDEASSKALRGADQKSIPTLDGMRGIAVLLVLAFHFAWTFPGDDPAASKEVVERLAVHAHAFLWSGWIGVDLFFVLSGYLITRGLVSPSKRALGMRMKMFWMRRVLRIFPIYYAVVIVGSILGLAVGGWIPGLAYWLYMQNYALAFDDEVLRWTAHFWSLAIEEQFYFVWPIVALTLSRRRLIPVILVLIVGTVLLRAGLTFKGASIGALHLFWSSEEQVAKFVYRATPTRADGLLLGAFVAVTQREVAHPVSAIWRRLRFPIFVLTSLALAGLYLLAGGLNDYDRRVIAIGYFTLALFFASAVSLCADGDIGERAARFLSSRPLVACGKVSYGMYIFHWPLVVGLVPRLSALQRDMALGSQIALGAAVIVCGTAVIYAAAAVSYRFFETPFLSLKGRFHD